MGQFKWFVQYLRKTPTLIDSMYFLYCVWIPNFKLKCILRHDDFFFLFCPKCV